jgi:hypothetical protein
MAADQADDVNTADTPAADTPAAEAAPVDAASGMKLTLTPREGLMLVRYASAKWVLGRLETLFLLKYLFLAIGVASIVFSWSTILSVIMLVIFGVLAAVQWVLTRIIRKLGAFGPLAELDQFIDGVATSWWPGLRDELKRVKLGSKPWALLKLASSLATRRLGEDESTKLRQVHWRSVLPINEWKGARECLARAADR